MDLDGSCGQRDSLTPKERRRRADAGLRTYCGHASHLIATCPAALRICQARGTFQYLSPGFALPPPGYLLPLAGFQFPAFQGPFAGPLSSI